MQVTNTRVYGLEESILASGYPMLSKPYTEEEFKKEIRALKYLTANKDFFDDFIKYQKEYGNWKFENQKDICEFCGSNTHVQKVNMKNEFHFLCSKHSHQYYKYKEVFETTPQYTLLDDCVKVSIVGDERKVTDILISYQDLPMFFYQRWHTNNNKGYCYNEDGLALHRVITQVTNPDIIVDHINRNPADNRRNNLRLCTNQENICNSSKRAGTNKYIGVSYYKERNKYKAYIVVNRKQIFLGYYTDEENALIARLNAEAVYFKEFSPQINLFKQYGIDFEIPQYKDNSIIFKKAIKHYNRGKTLGNAKIGSGHSVFLTGCIVQMDVTAPQYFWQQLQRYHFIDFVSSMSKMHCITKFDLDKQVDNSVSYEALKNLKEYIDLYQSNECSIDDVLQNVPMGLNLTARLTTNYLQLKTIYQQRKEHRSQEWHVFCDWIKTLPYAKELITHE